MRSSSRHITGSLRRLQPWQIWIDESVIGVNMCYCQYCTALFKQTAGIDPPVNVEADNEYWDQWITFHRQAYEQWMVKVNGRGQARKP